MPPPPACNHSCHFWSSFIFVLSTNVVHAFIFVVHSFSVCLHFCFVPANVVPEKPNTVSCGRKQAASYLVSSYLVSTLPVLVFRPFGGSRLPSPSKTHLKASLPTLISFSWPPRHKLRGRSNRLLGGAAGKPGPGQAGALTLRRPPIRSKLRGRMHRSNRCGAGSPGPGQAGAPRLRRRPTRNKQRTRPPRLPAPWSWHRGGGI